MKRFIIALLIVSILILSLAACTAAPTIKVTTIPSAEVSLSAQQSVSPSPSEASVSPVPSLTDSVSPSPSASVQYADIPDVENTGEFAADQIGIYENEKYIFFCDSYIYCINKLNNKMTKVSENDSSSPVLYNGMVYYVEDTGTNFVGGESETIRRYDPLTGQAEDIYSIKGLIYDVAVYKDFIYFICAADMNKNNPPTDLWAVKLDGTGEKCIRKNVGSFCIYKDTIYYMSYDSWERTTLYKCALDGSGKQKVIDNVFPQFQICNGKLYSVYSDTLFDLDTGTKTPVSLSGYDDGFTFWGQYILYIKGNYQPNDPKLYAYDIVTGKTYYLMDLGDYNAYLITSLSENAYVGLTDENGTHLSRLTIKSGKASLSEAAYIPDTGNYSDDGDGDE